MNSSTEKKIVSCYFQGRASPVGSTFSVKLFLFFCKNIHKLNEQNRAIYFLQFFSLSNFHGQQHRHWKIKNFQGFPLDHPPSWDEYLKFDPYRTGQIFPSIFRVKCLYLSFLIFWQQASSTNSLNAILSVCDDFVLILTSSCSNIFARPKFKYFIDDKSYNY